jgi:hypothetical protein
MTLGLFYKENTQLGHAGLFQKVTDFRTDEFASPLSEAITGVFSGLQKP